MALRSDCRTIISDILTDCPCDSISWEALCSQTSEELQLTAQKFIVDNFSIHSALWQLAVYETLTCMANNQGGIAMLDYDPELSRSYFAYIRYDNEDNTSLRLSPRIPGRLSREGFYYCYIGSSLERQSDVLLDVFDGDTIYRTLRLPIRSTKMHAHRGANERVKNAIGQLRIPKTPKPTKKSKANPYCVRLVPLPDEQKTLLNNMFMIAAHAQMLPFDMIGSRWSSITDSEDIEMVMRFVATTTVAVKNNRKASDYVQYLHTPDMTRKVVSDVPMEVRRPLIVLKRPREVNKKTVVLKVYFRNEAGDLESQVVKNNEIREAFREHKLIDDPVLCEAHRVHFFQ
jgi:hypothetical protein